MLVFYRYSSRMTMIEYRRIPTDSRVEKKSNTTITESPYQWEEWKSSHNIKIEWAFIFVVTFYAIVSLNRIVFTRKSVRLNCDDSYCPCWMWIWILRSNGNIRKFKYRWSQWGGSTWNFDKVFGRIRTMGSLFVSFLMFWLVGTFEEKALPSTFWFVKSLNAWRRVVSLLCEGKPPFRSLISIFSFLSWKVSKLAILWFVK